MASSLRSTDDDARLAAAHEYLPDAVPAPAFDRLTALAAQLCAASGALLAVNGRDGWVVVSIAGSAVLDLAEIRPLIDDVVRQREVLVGANARFLASAPIITPDGYAIGVLCVADATPRPLLAPQREGLRALADEVVSHLELGRQARELSDARQQAQWLAGIADNSDDAIIGTDPQGVITSWSRGGERVFGYRPDEVVGSRFERLIPEDLVGEHEAMLARVINGATVDHLRTLCLAKDKRLLDISLTIAPVRDREDRVVGALQVLRDVSVLRRIELTEDRYRALFQYAPFGIAIVDGAGYYLDANDNMCRMVGYLHDELVGRHVSDTVPPDEMARVEASLRDTRTGDEVQDWLIQRRDGSVFSAEVIATRLPDGKLLGMVRDVTERNKATAAIRAADERMRFVLESANVGLWDTDYTTGVTTWSRIAEAQYGLPPGGFGGTFEAFLACVHPDDRPAVIETATNAARDGSDYSSQHRALWPDGTVRWMSGTGRFHLDEQGRPARAVGIMVDVTERYTLEQQYQQAQKMDAIGRLAGGIAHDFNNLLMAILGYCELLTGALGKGDPRLEDVEEIEKASRRAASLTRQLLAFSRKQIVEPTVVDLNALVTDMRSMLARLIGEHIRVVMMLEPGLWTMKADPGQIEQVVLNLAVNARDAMPRGGTMSIATANVVLEHRRAGLPLLAAGRYVQMTVTDNGIGMTPAVMARAFEPFFTTKDVGQGSGLGLATVHGIVAQSGGEIQIESETGGGATFTLWFPAVDAEVAITVPQVASTSRGAGELVLVVEDAEGVRDLTRRLLERLGYQVLLAENAEHALNIFALQSERINILLTDVVMPGMSGPALAAELLVWKPTLKVLYMSGYTEDAIVGHGLAAARTTLLHKPFTSDALARKLADVLAQ